MPRPAVAVLSFALLLSTSARAATPDPLAGLPTELSAAFQYVSQAVRYEPYPGILRGPRGAAAAKSANAWDKALLLAELLRRGGYEVRFAEGTLEDGNLSVVLRGAFPPKIPNPNLGSQYAPYEPALDAQLRNAVNPHVWVEVNQGSSWLPLDPSFPRAKIGEAYAVALRRFSAPPDDAWQTLTVTWMEEGGGGRRRELARAQVRVADLGLEPISLSEVAIPLRKSAGARSQKAGGAAGMFGSAFGGNDKEEEAPKPEKSDGPPTGVLLKRTFEVGTRSGKVAETLVVADDQEKSFSRHWLELTIDVPGRQPRTIQRALLGEPGTGVRKLDELWGTRRYTIGVFSGPVSLGQLDAELAKARSLPLKDWTSDADELDAKQAAHAENAAGRAAGYLMTLSHAQASDALSDRLARSMGVIVVRDQPRLLISSIETTTEKGANPRSTVTLDLRLDEVRAVPFPGQASRTEPLFQVARGMVSSAIEGEVVSSATGRPAVTTAALMAQAREEGVALLSITPESIVGNSASLGQLTREGRSLIEEAVRRGRHAVVPAKALAMAGKPRTGFWEIDPDTGAAVGVMDDGLHQAMTQYSLNLEEVGMNEDTGMVLGGMVGAISVTGLLAAKILEHGAVTQKVLEDIKKLAEDVLCYSCPKAEAKVGVSVSAGNDCYSVEAEKSLEASAKIGFCEKYAQGFKCATAILLAAYGDKAKPFEAGGKFEASSELNCRKWPKEGN